MPIMSDLLEIDVDDQRSLLGQYIEETTTYYIICDECKGCTDDLTMSTLGKDLYSRGFRLRENERGRELVFCPKCAGTEK